ncbi:hypothetical protein [Arthrobacter sp. StoSoilB20]|uniref:hypothetical protein n=1 Tax=Arthrobacter sp. StoSoilB20 TaxID=2830995 RepID=UPI001CC58617|nr:hypothetical protein [Arthrobacter sp. StoSoilB20]BCW60777.1 hypothetical protein StoSoilB20_41240 [Arthrobacter sp. StoSoilB20]
MTEFLEAADTPPTTGPASRPAAGQESHKAAGQESRTAAGQGAAPVTGPVTAPTASAIPAPATVTVLAEELLGVVQAVDGVHAVYPAQPLWQSIAGAAIAAVTGEALPLIGLAETAGVLAVKVRIGVDASRPAPVVTREAAAAIRQHLLPRAAVVEISVVKLDS